MENKKYRNHKTGEEFKCIKDAYAKFCVQRDCDNMDCPLDPAHIGSHDCRDWVIKNPNRAAQLMGLEVVSDDHIGNTNKSTAMCSALGVEGDEVWEYSGKIYMVKSSTGELYVSHDGDWTPVQDIGVLYDMFDHPDNIIHKILTAEEVVVLAYICQCCGYKHDAVLERRSNVEKPLAIHDHNKFHHLPVTMFPSLRPGRAIPLANIAAGLKAAQADEH